MYFYDNVEDKVITDLEPSRYYTAQDGVAYKIWNIKKDGIEYSIAEYDMEEAIRDGDEYEQIDDYIAFYASYDDTVKNVFDIIRKI